MPRITKQVAISAPVAQVWQVLANFGAVENWAPTVVCSRASNELTSGAGAKRVLTTTSGEETEEVVIEWNEGRDFTFEIPDGLASIITILREKWSVEPASTGSVVAVAMEYHTKRGVFNSFVERLVVRRVLHKMLVQNLAGLKHHVETGEMVTQATKTLPVAAVV